MIQLVEGNTYNVSRKDMIIVRNDEFHQLFPKDEEEKAGNMAIIPENAQGQNAVIRQ